MTNRSGDMEAHINQTEDPERKVGERRRAERKSSNKELICILEAPCTKFMQE